MQSHFNDQQSAYWLGSLAVPACDWSSLRCSSMSWSLPCCRELKQTMPPFLFSTVNNYRRKGRKQTGSGPLCPVRNREWPSVCRENSMLGPHVASWHEARPHCLMTASNPQWHRNTYFSIRCWGCRGGMKDFNWFCWGWQGEETLKSEPREHKNPVSTKWWNSPASLSSLSSLYPRICVCRRDIPAGLGVSDSVFVLQLKTSRHTFSFSGHRLSLL